jgi:hypothetical protein
MISIIRSLLYFSPLKVVAFIPMLLVWCNLGIFEVLAHEIEYSNELSMSFVDLVLLWSLTKQGKYNTKLKLKLVDTGSGIFLVAGSVAMAIFQLFIYNGMGHTATGGLAGEHLAHYCEFFFEIVSALIVFWFCVDSKFVADKEIFEIMFVSFGVCLLFIICARLCP